MYSEELLVGLIKSQMVLIHQAQRKAMENQTRDNLLDVSDRIAELSKLNKAAINFLGIGILNSEKLEAAVFKSDLMVQEVQKEING